MAINWVRERPIQKFVICIYSILYILSFTSGVSGETGSGMPLKYISSCELDLNNDSELDIAILIETLKGRELIILIRTTEGYKGFLLSQDKPNMHLSCHFGKYIKETTAGNRKGRKFETNGTYIRLTQPESSSIAYFWVNGGFKEIWVAD